MKLNLVKNHKLRMAIYCSLAVLVIAPQFLLADLDDEREAPTSKAKTPSIFKPKTPAAELDQQKNTETNLGGKKSSSSTLAPSSIQPELAPINSQPSIPAKANDKKKKSITSSGSDDRKLPINWSAQGLRGSKDSKIVDLLKDVIVTQGNVKMESNKARVYLNANDEVTRVEASGDVKVSKDSSIPEEKMSARGNEAIFDNEKRTVTMFGRAALWRGGDVVRSKKIAYNLDTGWIDADSPEGVVQPGENGINGKDEKPIKK